MSEVVETEIPKFSRSYKSKHGKVPNFRLAMGTIQNEEPIVATIYPSGQFDYDERYTAIGSGSLLAEHFLRDPFVDNCDVETGKKLVGYIIQRVAEVDSNVDGIEVKSIDTDGNVDELSPAFITALGVNDVVPTNYDMNISEDIEDISNMSEAFEEAYEETDSE
jgi:20S proteasome alpha/beta subunit